MTNSDFKQLPKEGRVYHNLPPRSTEFIGREVELGQILAWVETSRWPLAAIEGMGGIGKTSLAIEVAYCCLPGPQLAVSMPFEAVVWTSARGSTDYKLCCNHVLDTIVLVLNYPHLAQLPPEQKVEAVDKLLRSHRTLVLVDNLETVTDLSLVKFLEQIPEPSKALVTTRSKQLRRVWDIPLYGLESTIVAFTSVPSAGHGKGEQSQGIQLVKDIRTISSGRY
jgi:LuxR family glucitol operon transcriptional activator